MRQVFHLVDDDLRFVGFQTLFKDDPVVAAIRTDPIGRIASDPAEDVFISFR